MHLAPEQLIDLAEGTAAESSAPHLAACEACRRQLADLREVMAAAANVEAPEPSPLFWDHLSARVSTAVAAESTARGWDWSRWRYRLPVALAAAMALVVVIASGARLFAPHESSAPPSMVFIAQPLSAPLPSDTLAPEVVDPSLALVADLTQDLTWDEAREAGLAARGSADHAVTHLSEGELRRLRDLLQAEMGNSGD